MINKALKLIILFIILFSCTPKEQNPFFLPYTTPLETPPFDKIKKEHYLPAFKQGIAEQQREIEAIANASEEPSFENTLEAMEKSGDLLRRVTAVFFSMNAALTDDTMQSIAKEAAPLLSEHTDNTMLNAKLFNRIKTVYERRDSSDVTPEQRMLLRRYYKDFVRGGANLDESKKARFREINKELSVLSLKFEENILKENNAFELVIENNQDLAGLPDPVILQAKETARERSHEGKWVFTLHKPSMIPFLQYSQKRELREKIFRAYINRGNNSNELDNKENLVKIVNLRIEKAKLLGYKTHADFVLEDRMANTPAMVYDFLNRIWTPAIRKATEEAKTFQAMIDKETTAFKLEPWDWWYYAEKLKKAQYDFNDEALKPYFKLENVLDGAFTVANKLFGITFSERTDIPKYHEDVRVFEVKEADGSHIGLLYTDFYVRASKGGGAWMDSYRKQSAMENATPLVYNVCNFAKPTSENPTLLNLDETTTLFHEFGHALHGLLSQCRYTTLSGTSVYTDFVELPSQIMENWAVEPSVLSMYAKHYQTGEPIPKELADKIDQTSRFNQGFASTEYLAASFLDMDWHTLEEPVDSDPLAFENSSLSKIGLIPQIVARYRSPYFAHIFASGYSAGYYSYLWSELLDADAFAAFKETDLFNKQLAESFRKNVLAAGGTDEPMALYKRFRGAEPKIDALLKRKGFN